MRSYDIFDFASESFTVKLANPLFGAGPGPQASEELEKITEWANAHCEGDYLILLTSVAFKREADAIIFKLKYGY